MKKCISLKDQTIALNDLVKMCILNITWLFVYGTI